MAKKLTNEEFQNKLLHLREAGSDVFTDDLYQGNKRYIDFYCSKMHYWPAFPNHILKGSGCPYCSGRFPIVGETDLWTTRPDIAIMLKNKDDGYKYSRGSHKYVDFICPDCGAILNKEIKTVCQQGLGCKYCSDHISYPNKFIREILKHTDAKNVIPEWSPEWIGGYRYDIYFTINNQEYIIEMDGGLGHNNREIRSGNRLTGAEVDAIKDHEAKAHNIILIRIDCNYEKISERFEYIRNNVICSELSDIIDLSGVPWSECNRLSMVSYVIGSAKMFNAGVSIQDISDYYNYSTHTIRQWLYQAEEIGICDCTAIRGTKRGTKPYKVCLHQYSMDGDYIATYESATKAHQMTGVLGEYICRSYKDHKPAGGFLWFEASDPTQPDKTKIIFNTQQNDCKEECV